MVASPICSSLRWSQMAGMAFSTVIPSKGPESISVPSPVQASSSGASASSGALITVRISSPYRWANA